MKTYILGTAAAALTLALPTAASATDFPVGSDNFFITSGDPFSPSITATFWNGFDGSVSFDDSFNFTIPQNGWGSGSITTSFSSSDLNALTITDLFINGERYDVPSTGAGQSLEVGGIPIIAFALNTIRVVGFTTGSGTYAGTATFAAAPIPEPSLWIMMIAGFGAVGMALRRRVSTRVAFS
ncbi:MAG TPA: FxDxF family PEP-CTERM protein [Sphingobium sp.]|nr:FxDxF family PEP-CTERM protein [Sphingobium sp.]